jgi:DNA-binding transcriptional LysR family regulator
MNIENIEAFVFVIHSGSFNKAAEALYLSQPSVTARIQSLERELDCKLFERQGKQIQITEEGRRFLPYAQQLLMTYKRGKQAVNRNKSSPEEFKIGCTVSVSNYIIPDLLPRLREKHLNTHYKIITGTTDEIVAKVVNKEINMGFVRQGDYPHLQSAKFYEDPIKLYAYEDHPLVGSESVTIEEIANQPFVFFECGALDWIRIHRIFETIGRPPNIRIQTDNSEMAKKLVIRKAGISFLPELCAQQEVSDGKLVHLHVPETEGITLQTYVVTPLGENIPLLETILEFGRELMLKGYRTFQLNN